MRLGVPPINRQLPRAAPLLLALAIAGALALLPAAEGAAVPPDPLARAAAYLSDNGRALGLGDDPSDLRLSGQRSSLTGDHVRYQQTVNGVPVFGATVLVSIPNVAGVEPVVTSRYTRSSPATGIVSQTPAQGFATASQGVANGPSGAEEAASPELVYFPSTDKTLRPAWQLMLRTTDPLGTWLVLTDAITGEILYERNLLVFDNGQVFDPNPAQSNGGYPPAPHCDYTYLEMMMSAEYVATPLLGITPGQDKLKGEWVDVTATGIKGGYKPAGIANEPSRSYVYGCDDDRFEEVMAYHHLDRTQRKFQALGFTGPVSVLARPVPVHPHFMGGCNAFFDPTNRGLHFGDFDDSDFLFGCPFDPPHYDAAEDADVIIHEYGHAVHDDQVPGWGFGFSSYSHETWSMGEGFADFLAGVINNDPCIGEYIYFGEFSCGGNPGLRWLQNTMTYPAGYGQCGYDFDGDTIPDDVEPHCGGQLWSGALWDLVETLGGGVPTQQSRDLALTLVLESHFYLDQAATFSEAAAAVCLVDKILYGGVHTAAITNTFGARGISTGSCTASDFPSLYLRVKHPWSGDLDINVKIGPDVNSPVCTIDVVDPEPQLNYPDAYVGYDIISTCAGFLPPTVGQPWWLEVQDVASQDLGTIEDFQILVSGGTRCYTGDTPMPIPDAGGPVYAKVDCSLKVEAPPTPTPIPTPGPASFGNVDCTGGINSVDGLKVLRANAGLSVSQAEPCEDIGVETLPSGELQGDVDCSDTVTAVDALKLLRWGAGLLITQAVPCPAVGT